jgi:hypothetical protein
MEHDGRLAALYRAAVAGTEPSPALDDTIRAAAQRAVAETRETAGWTAVRSSWRVPLSIAAMVVLSISLVTLVREQRPNIDQPATADTAKRKQPLADQLTVEPSSPQATIPERNKIAIEPIKKRSVTPLAEPPEPLLMQRREAVPPAQVFPGAADGKRDSANVPAAAAPANELAPTPQSVRTEADTGASVAGALSKPALSGVVGAGKSASEQRARTVLPPDQWLKQIEGLRQDGKFAEVKTELAEFRKYYPDYPLPAALKPWGQS